MGLLDHLCRMSVDLVDVRIRQITRRCWHQDNIMIGTGAFNVDHTTQIKETRKRCG